MHHYLFPTWSLPVLFWKILVCLTTVLLVAALFPCFSSFNCIWFIHSLVARSHLCLRLLRLWSVVVSDQIPFLTFNVSTLFLNNSQIKAHILLYHLGCSPDSLAGCFSIDQNIRIYLYNDSLYHWLWSIECFSIEMFLNTWFVHVGFLFYYLLVMVIGKPDNYRETEKV